MALSGLKWTNSRHAVYVRYWHLADNPTAPAFVRYWSNSGQRAELSMSANNPKQTLGVISAWRIYELLRGQERW